MSPESKAANLPAHLKRVRLARGLSRAAIARLAGVSDATWWRWEAGEREPSLAMLRRLATALDLDRAALGQAAVT